MNQTSGNGNYLANQIVSEEQIQTWVDQFHRDGFSVPSKCLAAGLVCPDARRPRLGD